MRMDPLELRVRNYAERDFYHHADWSSKHLDECYRLGAERFGWPGHYVEPRSMPDGYELVVFGVATTVYPAVAWPARARVEAFDNGEIHVAVAGHHIRTGLYDPCSGRSRRAPPSALGGSCHAWRHQCSGGSSTRPISPTRAPRPLRP